MNYGRHVNVLAHSDLSEQYYELGGIVAWSINKKIENFSIDQIDPLISSLQGRRNPNNKRYRLNKHDIYFNPEADF